LQHLRRDTHCRPLLVRAAVGDAGDDDEQIATFQVRNWLVSETRKNVPVQVLAHLLGAPILGRDVKPIPRLGRVL
jgi:hypothetical protein